MSKQLEPMWNRPSVKYHAHFDCFSGAAGDMMLAACLDAAGPSLLPYIQFCLEQGLPALKGEFSLLTKQVWRSRTGSIAANYLSVRSKYNHAPAPVPDRAANDDHLHVADSGVEHNHAHSQDHNHQRQDHQDDALPTHDHSHGHSLIHGNSSAPGTNGPLRNLPEIRKLLEEAPVTYIPDWVKDLAIAAFTDLARAEALTHGAASSDSVHFHEVGAVDSIVDTVGTCLALYCLGVTTISCSRLPLGEGTVWTQHGLLPVPAPATLRLLLNMPTCPGPPGVTGELVTPTAAALLKVLTTTTMPPSKIPGRPPCLTIRKIGIGAGTKDFAKHPNILRLIIGDQLA
jgi:pyridinium-3,5-bisthiocarboxylic acid mononucleotide nickel chelatase